MHLVLEVVVDALQVRHPGHVAVDVVLILAGVGAVVGIAREAGGLQAVAVRVVGVVAGPASAVGRVDHPQDVADLIVEIALGVAAHGLPVVGVGQVAARRVVEVVVGFEAGAVLGQVV